MKETTEGGAAERKAKARAFIREFLKKPKAERETLLAGVTCLAVTTEGRSLSPMNTILLTFQGWKQGNIVGGFRQWRQHGRSVKRGEHGLAIWIPCQNSCKDEETGETVKGEVFFRCGTVFLDTQTEELTDETQDIEQIA